MRLGHWLFPIPLRLRSLFRWAQADQELDEELRDHLKRKTDEYVAQGMTQEEAHHRARIDLGGIEQTKEKCRDARRVNRIQDFFQDLHFGLRMLRKSPGFAAIAILTLALGIGINTALFTIVNSVVLNPLPYPQPSRLVSIYQRTAQFQTAGDTYPNFLDWEKENRSFDALAAYSEHDFNLTGVGEPEKLRGQMVSAGFFSMLGVKPLLGRTFRPEEDQLGANPVVRSEEHTSELQSRLHLVCRLLLEKKNNRPSAQFRLAIHSDGFVNGETAVGMLTKIDTCDIHYTRFSTLLISSSRCCGVLHNART